MNLEQRLHHAARELREVSIETPPLGRAPATASSHAPPRRLPMLVAPVLFVLGGLVMVAGVVRPTTTPASSDPPASSSVPAVAELPPSPEAEPLSPTVEAVFTVDTTPLQELRLIASLVSSIEPAVAVEPPIVRPGPTGVV